MFITTNEPGYLKMLLQVIFLALVIFALGSFISVNSQTVKPDPATRHKAGTPPANDDRPLLREYRGITLGMPAQEVRRKLGEPADGGNEQDFYNFSENESAQVFYDETGSVKAVSAHYAGERASDAPAAKTIFGEEALPRDDGSVFKLVRYPSAGYWVSYSRTVGDRPLVTISMQKLH